MGFWLWRTLSVVCFISVILESFELLPPSEQPQILMAILGCVAEILATLKKRGE